MAHSKNRTPWFLIPGFRKELILHDWLHVGPLGLQRDYAGSICLDLLLRGELQSKYGGLVADHSADSLLNALWCDYREWSFRKGAERPRGNLTLKGLRESARQYPELPSSFKGSVVQSFSMFLGIVCQEFADDDHGQLRALCAWGMCDFLHVMGHAGLVMTVEQTDRLVHAGNTYVRCYCVLAERAATNKIWMWKVRPKCHSYEHMLSFALTSRLNPQRLACWSDESFLGKLKVVAQHCASTTMLKTSLLRFFIYVGLRWQRRRATGLWDLPT